jgi:hypothetical protein
VTQVVFAPASWPLVLEGLHDTLFHKAIIVLFVGGRPLGVLTSGYVDDQSSYLPFLTGVCGVLMGALSLLASVLVQLVLRKMNRVSPFVRLRQSAGPDKRGVSVGRSQTAIARADRKVQRYRTALVALSLTLLIVGAGCVLAPVRVPATSVFREFEFPALVPNDDEVSVPFTMSQTARVSVVCNATASDRLMVWLGYEAGFHSFLLSWSAGGTITLWENQSRVEFTFGLENASLFLFYYDRDPLMRTLFLNAISIEVYYSGIHPAACSISIYLFQNPFVVSGLVIVGIAAVPLWCLVGLVWHQYQITRRKLAELTIGSADDAGV